MAVGDQVARAAQEATLAAGDVVLDPFAPAPLDPAALTGTPAERLAQVEAALCAADAHAGRSVRAAKVRWTIEKGTVLAILVEHDLYLARGHASLDAYADDVLHMARGYIYELIADAERLQALRDTGLSDFSDTPLLAAHANVLPPALALEDGGQKARNLLTEVNNSGKKITAAALKTAAKQLGYASVLPAQPRFQELDDTELSEKVTTKLTAAADAAERALALYEEALALGAPPADPARADADLARLTKAGRVLAKQTRTPGE